MKVYDYQWSASFGMDAETAARELVHDGIDTVLVRNQIDPLPTSGVDQEGYLGSGQALSVAADRRWSDALRAAGLREVELIELPMLVGHYEMLAMTLNALKVEPDALREGRPPRLARIAARASARSRGARSAA